MSHANIKKTNGDYSTISTIGLTFLQSSHDATGALMRGINAFYAEEVGNIDDLFATDVADRDSIHGQAMARLYDKIIAMVTSHADQTPVASQAKISVFVRHWRLKYDLSNG